MIFLLNSKEKLRKIKKMSAPTRDQVLFILRSTGQDIYLKKMDVNTLFQRAVSNPIGKLAYQIAVTYQLGYDTNGKIILGKRPTLEQIRAILKSINVIVPDYYNDDNWPSTEYTDYYMPYGVVKVPRHTVNTPEDALTFFERYGKYYLLTPDQIKFIEKATSSRFQFYREYLQKFYEDGVEKTVLAYDINGLHAVRDYWGRLAAAMAQEYQLSYDADGNIVLGNPPSGDEIRSRVQNIGMWIPYPSRTSPEAALTYYQNFAAKYKFKYFNRPTTPPQELAKLPLTGNDPYLFIDVINPNPLQPLTDFDLFDVFPFLRQPDIISKFVDRASIINYLEQVYNPVGHFGNGYGYDYSYPYDPTNRARTKIRTSRFYIDHRYQGQTIKYTNQEIKSMARDGYLYFGDLRLPHIGLYKLAAHLKPEYQPRVTELGLLSDFYEILKELYEYVLGQIRIAENRGERKYRFSDLLSEFNADLDREELPDISKLRI